ncbi:hypothetical protein [Chryseobacterium jejuense]|uniref:Secretion system C-terminal sorting domain-containing protein n=1 Tax=Chryseobacterium jejuense TaxID=445960 RepID=A0A2X2Z6H2_CHRJE|nr:hypothetical protein [Chryseobacterium jejuense]SDJ32124.1 hypothetical protein SAMN05421542_3177 [Chryseobacterium jejuense]SQB45379.1 Uncharacterised protein [Chryseobacterium jejuense]
MKKNYLNALFLCTTLGVSAQQKEVYFKYDEAGNQRYRGPESSAKQTSDTLSKKESQTTSLAIDEKEFWKQIRLYPVPVNDVLTIDWTEQVDGLVESVSLYQHSTVHWKFQQQNIPDLNRQLKINMTGYEWGVYVIRFTLKDGRIFSKNITKR